MKLRRRNRTTAAESSAAAAPGAASDAPAADPVPPPVDDVPTRQQVARLEAEGRLEEAVDALAAAHRHAPEPGDEARLIDLRAKAAAALDPGAGREPWPPSYADPFPGLVGAIPEIAAAELTPDVLGGAVAHHGALIVRGVFAPDQVDRLADAIETTHLSQVDEGDNGAKAPAEESAWYRPFPTTQMNEVLRRMVARQGGTWLADSPASTEVVLAELDACGVTEAIATHLGERPVFSLQKSTLRRSLPKFNLVAWHQDGSFLDADVRTMNVWVALSPCGGDRPSPGLEILPTRLPDILPVDGVMSPHSVSYDLVAELAEDVPTVIPSFDPGDAIIFDEHLLHRTHLTEHMSEIRYALECWFFAPSHPASTYIPLLA